jgi:hypothetical protein
MTTRKSMLEEGGANVSVKDKSTKAVEMCLVLQKKLK